MGDPLGDRGPWPDPGGFRNFTAPVPVVFLDQSFPHLLADTESDTFCFSSGGLYSIDSGIASAGAGIQEKPFHAKLGSGVAG